MANGALSFMGANPELLKQALAMQGKDTSFLDNAETTQPSVVQTSSAPTPATVPAQDPVNQALETTGSDFRVPETTSSPSKDNGWGALEPGNVDLSRRPHVKNPDGTTSTVRSMGVNIDGKEYLIPTVNDKGYVMGDEEAIQEFMRTGKHMGVYSSPEAATAAADAIHNDQMVNVPKNTLLETPSIDTSKARGTKRDYLEGVNRSMGLAEEKGTIAAEGADKQAVLAGELESKRRDGLTRADSRHDSALARKDFNTERAYAALDDMARKVKNPPDNTTGKVLSIIGSVLSMGSGGKAVGAGLQMLGKSLSTDLEEWAQGISGDETIRKAMLEMNAHEDAGQESELNQESKLSALAAGVYEAAINKVVAETGSKEAKRVGEELKNGLRQKYLEHQMAVEKQSAALGQQSAIIRAIAGQPTPEARAALAAQYGKQGLAALAEIQKGDKTATEIQGANLGNAKTAAEIQKLRGEAGGKNAEVLPGFIDTVGLEKGDLADVRKNARITAMIENDIKQLKAIRQKHNGGTFNQNDVAAAKDIISGITGKMSQYSGAGAPSEAEREMFIETMTDPTGFYATKDPMEIYDAKIARLKAGQRASYEAIGLMPTTQGSGDTPGSYDPAFKPGTTSTPTAASRGITRDQSGQIALPNAKVNLTAEQAAGIPEAFLRGR